jgi:hypothetical protein
MPEVLSRASCNAQDILSRSSFSNKKKNEEQEVDSSLFPYFNANNAGASSRGGEVAGPTLFKVGRHNIPTLYEMSKDIGREIQNKLKHYDMCEFCNNMFLKSDVFRGIRPLTLHKRVLNRQYNV